MIGNPPYIRVQNLAYNYIDSLKEKYKTALKRIDISLCFIELSKNLLCKDTGIATFITSNQFLTTEYGKAMREFILKEYPIEEYIDLGDLPIFENALTYVGIFRFKAKILQTMKYSYAENMQNVKLMKYPNFKFIDYNSLSFDNWNLRNSDKQKIFQKMKKNSKVLIDIGHCHAGLITGCDKVLMFSDSDLGKLPFEKDILLPVLRADNCNKYIASKPHKYVIYPYVEENWKTRILTEKELEKKYPKAYKYLCKNKDILEKRKDSRKTISERTDWYGLVRFGRKEVFNQIKIISPGEVQEHKFCIDDSKAGFSCARVFAITIENPKYAIKYVLAVLNSDIMKAYIQSIASLKNGGYYQYSANILNRCPIPAATPEQQQEIISLVDQILAAKKNAPQADTTSLESEIDKKVYALYGLTEEEIKIVEGK